MVKVLFEVLVEGLKLANTKESTKYLDEVLKLQKEWQDEYNKPRSARSNHNLDELQLRLELISKHFVTSLRK